MGKLIVLEGTDCSGKETQAKKLFEALSVQDDKVRLITFPDYDSDFSLPVRRYLAGDLGTHPDDVNAYAASLLYAIDRYASCKREWGAFYRAGGTLVADRYVTSNLVHQAAKLSGDKQDFIIWLSDLEYNKLELPRPDLVFFLDMPPEYARLLLEKRSNKITGSSQKDIHERDLEYLERSYQNALAIAELCQWQVIQCVREEKIRNIEEIHAEILHKTLQLFENEA